ncbi:phospholipid-transporting ATPase IA-like [Corticium candelabrum]|uniref:phospholipid-transporting ATPase IA-like n=1 Tax=Corticium candelabrum TaxID=121492 RepID=UPI002E27023C|nr:phospholipid-transporting ATPase IA-like [Corticium candelabrum]
MCEMDDVLVSGVDCQEHDLKLMAVLDRLQAEGVMLNKEKCLAYNYVLIVVVVTLRRCHSTPASKKRLARNLENGVTFSQCLRNCTMLRTMHSTAKYSLVTFLPKFLFEQFQRYSNVFFLFISILQQIPGVSPTGRWNTLFPLFIVLFATALKEIVEDWKRHQADHQINDRCVRVWWNGTFLMLKWAQVKVGNIVKVVSGEFFPADLLLLSSSEPNAICYIETANLDGETNLKIRQGLAQTKYLTSTSDILSLQGSINCEHPNNKLYEFVGNIILKEQAAAPLGPSNLLLRGAQLKNTQWIYDYQMGYFVVHALNLHIVPEIVTDQFYQSTIDYVENIANLLVQSIYVDISYTLILLCKECFNMHNFPTDSSLSKCLSCPQGGDVMQSELLRPESKTKILNLVTE